jgi:hypothetical protein
MAICGREGSGKTFNAFLLSLRLSQEGNKVYYCPDLRDACLTQAKLRAIATTRQPSALFIIDKVENDEEKAQKLVSAVSHEGSYANQPLFLFLSRPLDEQTFLDIFGFKTPTVNMVDKFVDFERLVTLFFEKRGRPQDAINLLGQQNTAHLPGIALDYRNMAFWNEVLRSLPEGGYRVLTPEQILASAHSFFSRHESHLMSSCREPLMRLLPLFSQGIGIHLDYARQLLGADADGSLKQLEQHGILRKVAQDWSLAPDRYDRTSVLIAAPSLHLTKAKLLTQIFGKYYAYSADPLETTANYAERFRTNLHYILASYHRPDDFRLLFTNERIRSITRQYLMEQRLGRQLDFLIRHIRTLDVGTRDLLLDDEVLAAFAQKINAGVAYLVSTMNLLRTLYRLDPQKAVAVFKNLRPDAIIDRFIKDPPRASTTWLAKIMEIFKNIYKAAPKDARETVRLFVRKIVEQCRAEFVRRITENDPFITQIHWMLKRLHPLGLDSYFMEGIALDELIELIRTKDTNILELSRYILSTARRLLWPAPNSQQRTYYEMLREKLTYDDLKRVFDNERSGFFNLVINATHEFVAKALVRYVDDPNFTQKLLATSPFLCLRSLNRVSSNPYLTQEEKERIREAIWESLLRIRKSRA